MTGYSTPLRFLYGLPTSPPWKCEQRIREGWGEDNRILVLEIKVVVLTTLGRVNVWYKFDINFLLRRTTVWTSRTPPTADSRLVILCPQRRSYGTKNAFVSLRSTVCILITNFYSCPLTKTETEKSVVRKGSSHCLRIWFKEVNSWGTNGRAGVLWRVLRLFLTC